MTASRNDVSQPKTSGDPKPYEPTPRDHEAMEAHFARCRERMPAPRLKVTEKKGVTQVATDHPDPKVGQSLLLESLGTADHDFLDGVIQNLANVGSPNSGVDERGLNFLLAMVRGVEPRDQVETMLAAQMAVVHDASMSMARRLARAETITQQDAAERALNKLARTFTAQVEALKRYRTGGEQRVKVEHVHVHEGGQAIVGAVTQGVGCQQIWRIEPMQIGLPVHRSPRCRARTRSPCRVAGGQRPQLMPDARRCQG